ncbi:hypothetical protein E2562_030058 [Oryza meyeriana var. granulata]|uniref:Uncharacterized protein n=1 Tax=Oryza meyeriana var. granulata TaxID=110450 RepID=A0A6G1CV11_9ORYZ|nr:hypothetical protein E2562_030058 [Oryza meyeriana var. granulata]
MARLGGSGVSGTWETSLRDGARRGLAGGGDGESLQKESCSPDLEENRVGGAGDGQEAAEGRGGGDWGLRRSMGGAG